MTEPVSSPPIPPLERHPLRRARVRAGWHGLIAGVALALVFSVWPGIDLWVSGQFRDVGDTFIGDRYLWVRFLYRAVPIIGWSYALLSIAALVIGHRRPDRVPFRWRRRAASLLLVSVLGSLLLINAFLKEHWGRARPREVAELIGPGPTHRHFTPALVPTDQCVHNCSFSSGHAASGFVIMAVGLMGPVAVRRRWWWIGVTLGVFASLARVMQGGHFLSDTLFSGWLLWACGWLVREAWLWWVARRRRRARAAA
jgi:lipid A 4'-phosphatase